MPVSFRDESPGEAEFRTHQVWTIYQYPEELEDLKRWGVPDLVVHREILAKVEAAHCHPYYSIPAGVPMPFRDLLYVAVDVRFKDPDLEAFGYLVLSDHSPTVLRIFQNGIERMFYHSPLEDGDNREDMRQLFPHAKVESRVAQVSPIRDLPEVPLPGSFEIPC